MAIVVGIHGAFHELWGPNQLKSRWLPALQDGLWHHGVKLEADEFDMTFYGDIFRYDPQFGPPEDDELIEVAQRSGLVDAAETKMGLGGLDGLAEAIGLEVLRRLVHQLARYFSDETIRNVVRGRLEDRISADTRVIVSHSMGTVVAYEALCLHPEWPVTTFVTLGSPLGGPFVQTKLTPQASNGVRAWPSGLTSWTNVAANRDSVVVDPTLDHLFDGAIDDVTIDNGHRTHDAEPYLNAAITGFAVASALRSTPTI